MKYYGIWSKCVRGKEPEFCVEAENITEMKNEIRDRIQLGWIIEKISELAYKSYTMKPICPNCNERMTQWIYGPMRLYKLSCRPTMLKFDCGNENCKKRHYIIETQPYIIHKRYERIRKKKRYLDYFEQRSDFEERPIYHEKRKRKRLVTCEKVNEILMYWRGNF